ncbi:glycoside hydrolase family 125 protein [Streptomyces fagopyri]|uniref:glycoside hydrolase family 125 protein n=1 Tax=Streptomyces fagopyri TaxID=2662397 RepID=UPI0033E6983D
MRTGLGSGDTSLHRRRQGPDDPHRFTRPWFSWANAIYAELALDVAELGTRPLWSLNSGG